MYFPDCRAKCRRPKDSFLSSFSGYRAWNVSHYISGVRRQGENCQVWGLGPHREIALRLEWLFRATSFGFLSTRSFSVPNEPNAFSPGATKGSICVAWSGPRLKKRLSGGAKYMLRPRLSPEQLSLDERTGRVFYYYEKILAGRTGWAIWSSSHGPLSMFLTKDRSRSKITAFGPMPLGGKSGRKASQELLITAVTSRGDFSFHFFFQPISVVDENGAFMKGDGDFLHESG